MGGSLLTLWVDYYGDVAFVLMALVWHVVVLILAGSIKSEASALFKEWLGLSLWIVKMTYCALALLRPTMPVFSLMFTRTVMMTFSSVADQAHARLLLPQWLVLLLATIHSGLVVGMAAAHVPEVSWKAQLFYQIIATVGAPYILDKVMKWYYPAANSSSAHSTRVVPNPAVALASRQPGGESKGSKVDPGRQNDGQRSAVVAIATDSSQGHASGRLAGPTLSATDIVTGGCMSSADDPVARDEGFPMAGPGSAPPRPGAPVQDVSAVHDSPKLYDARMAGTLQVLRDAVGCLDPSKSGVSIHPPRTRQYHSRLYRPVTLAIKLRGDLTPGDLPQDLKQQLQNAFTSSGAVMRVIGDMGVRQGCIHITLGVLFMRPNKSPGQRQRASSPGSPVSPLTGPGGELEEEEWDTVPPYDLAALMLPVIQKILRNTVLDLDPDQLPSEQARIQIGNAMISCYYMGNPGNGASSDLKDDTECGGGEWQLLALSDSLLPAVGVKLGAVVLETAPETLDRPSFSNNPPVHTLDSQESAKEGLLVDANNNALRLGVQVWGLLAGDTLGAGWTSPGSGKHTSAWPQWQHGLQPTTPVSYSGTASITREEPWASLSEVEDVCGLPPIQVLVRVGAAYLRTDVAVRPGPLAPDASSMTSQLVTCVDVVVGHPETPATWLQHHTPAHMAIMSAGLLQPLTVELWRGDVMLDSTCVLVPQPRANSPTSTPTTDSVASIASDQLERSVHECAWWGADAWKGAAAVSELSAASASVWAQGADVDPLVLQSHLDLVQDVSLFIHAVSACALNSGWCRVAASMHTMHTMHTVVVPALDDAQWQQLSEDLIAYAHGCGMHALAAWIEAQYQAVVAAGCSMRTATCSWAVVRCMHNLMVAAWGYPCSLCESAYRQWLHQHLAGFQNPMSMGLCCVYWCSAAQMLISPNPDLRSHACMVPWLLAHLCVVWHHWKQRGVAPTARTCSPGGSYAFVVRIVLELLWLAGGFPVSRVFTEAFFHPVVFVAIQSLVALTEKLQAVIFFPAPVLTTLVGLRAGLLLLVMRQYMGPSKAWVWWPVTVMMGTGSRFALDAWLRASGMWRARAAFVVQSRDQQGNAGTSDGVVGHHGGASTQFKND